MYTRICWFYLEKSVRFRFILKKFVFKFDVMLSKNVDYILASYYVLTVTLTPIVEFEIRNPSNIVHENGHLCVFFND